MIQTLLRTQQDVEALYSDVHQSLLDTSHIETLTGVMGDLEVLHSNYFDGEVDPSGQGWAPLAPSTVARKGHDDILRETGRLRASLTGSSPDALRDIFEEGDNTGMTFGSLVEYAGYHITGTANMPARVEVGMSEPVFDAIANLVIDHTLTELIE